jgi:hypothetical protein
LTGTWKVEVSPERRRDLIILAGGFRVVGKGAEVHAFAATIDARCPLVAPFFPPHSSVSRCHPAASFHDLSKLLHYRRFFLRHGAAATRLRKIETFYGER